MSSLFKKIMQFKICKAEINYKRLNPKNWKKPSFKKIIKGFAFFVIFLAALIIIKYEYEYQFESDTSNDDTTIEEGIGDEESDCNVLGIELRGDVVTYVSPKDKDEEGNNTVDETSSEDIIYLIDQANTDDNIKAIILEVDSYGGSAVAAEEINQALQSTDKPTVAFVRSAAASAAYWAASGADTIFASPLSDIGSIGVTMSYLDNTKKNAKDGLTYNSLSTGKFKDYGNPDKILTEDEKKLIMRDLNITHDIFINTISKNRSLPIEKVKALADGSSMPGQMALENELIDQLGDIYKVENYLKDKLGEDVEVCWY
ncbi:signal peptide peptidase SppA [Candidatus Falkowbacteria bacterium]|nr:signal peptide peptidase SppA [Candidatus Falkowbacteria bacterium]